MRRSSEAEPKSRSERSIKQEIEAAKRVKIEECEAELRIEP